MYDIEQARSDPMRSRAIARYRKALSPEWNGLVTFRLARMIGWVSQYRLRRFWPAIGIPDIIRAMSGNGRTGDWVSVLEASYSLDGDDSAWLGGLLDCIAREHWR